jgi:hypothetical protein
MSSRRKGKLILHKNGYWYSLDNPDVHIVDTPEPSLKDIYLQKLREAPIQDMPYRLPVDAVRYHAVSSAPFVKYPVK